MMEFLREGQYAQAIKQAEQCRKLRKTVLGEQHRAYASSLYSLAALYRSTGDFVRAEAFFRKTLEIEKSVLGEQHPAYANSLNNLAGLYRDMGDYARAEPLYKKATEITLGVLEATATVQSQRQQLAMGTENRSTLDTYLSLAFENEEWTTQAYSFVLRWKGSVWVRQKQLRAARDNPEWMPRFAELQRVAGELSNLIHQTPPPEQVGRWQQRLDELVDQRETIESELSRVSAEFRATSEPVTPQQLRQHLQPGETLVDLMELSRYERRDRQLVPSRHLAAFVVRSDRPVELIDLGELAPITAAVETWRSGLGGSVAARQAGQSLRRMVWAPVEARLEGISRVYVSPDGAVGRLPLAALPGRDPDRYLLEDWSIVILPVPQDLAVARQVAPRGEPTTDAERQSPPEATSLDRFLLVGGVDYDAVSKDDATPRSEPAMLAVRGSGSDRYQPLPGPVVGAGLRRGQSVRRF